MSKTTSDLELAISGFMKAFADKRFISRHCRDELEGHLRDEIEDLMSVGHSFSEAFKRAAIAFGRGDELLKEYSGLYRGKRWTQINNVLSYYFDGRFIMRLCFGAVLGLLFILGGLRIEGGSLRSVMQITAFLITFGGALGALIITYPIKTVLNSFSLALTGREALRSSYIDAARVFKSFGNLAVFSGLGGFIIGVIHVLSNLVNPERIGSGAMVGILCIFYTAMMKLFVSNPMHDAFIAKAYPSHEEQYSSDDKRMSIAA